MARKLFGTDGIRGRSNTEPMTAVTALTAAVATGRYFTSADKRRHVVVIGKDTRLSGYMLEPALVAGFSSVGMDVVTVGPLPTPAIAMLTRSLRADLGVMISASHNPFDDNGIKLFGPDGFKLSDEVEGRIEAMIEEGPNSGLAEPERLGRVQRLEDARGRYIEFVKASFPRGLRLDGLKIAIDCANGAAYKVAPTVLWELGATVISVGVNPDGYNINRNCGAVHPEHLQTQVVTHRAHIGIALDGDADRLIVVDEKGEVIDGDQILALIAGSWAREGKLKGCGVVATLMSNFGLERHLKRINLDLVRTKVGDRYVVEHMRSNGHNLGGEQSGHVVMTDYATTGDGLVAALQVLAVLKQTNRKASEILRVFEPAPQVLKNVRFAGQVKPLDTDAVKKTISSVEERLGSRGRLVVRKSGTEPLIRVMAQGEDAGEVKAAVDEVVAAVERAAAG
ncbi:MAG: phosphoglucosamine mutase [Alphaproteobacteria bacterium]|nr:phosphoglucosamine mutase [Alphaproteobacteria bacterium]